MHINAFLLLPSPHATPLAPRIPSTRARQVNTITFQLETITEAQRGLQGWRHGPMTFTLKGMTTWKISGNFKDLIGDPWCQI